MEFSRVEYRGKSRKAIDMNSISSGSMILAIEPWSPDTRVQRGYREFDGVLALNTLYLESDDPSGAFGQALILGLPLLICTHANNLVN
jgi:hypothetical protein